ncbi:MAG: DUF4860 domain-containing protein [Eubacteriales bacterium]|jgi:type II secretory pathway component PulJ|nr:DUF4860 domain-containing protein [Eubacteriales bacterium]MDD3196862.1 DUF4860 domain-containing protein [Eubacteriales bacterium]MDD3504715.1 DUF4860 domain-containing protein [Eubacteriales bacterium]MDD4682523.1 DUF4860 domain-containing protein [Eubacteriales bacterium]
MKFRNRRGYSLAELVLVMMLLILVASLVFSLTAAGSQAWLRLSESGSDRAALRTAMSYIDVQLKKSDDLDAISVETDPYANGNAIRIVREIKNPTIPDYNQSIVWIYLYDGYLHELHTMPGMEQPLTEQTSGRALTRADGWSISVVADNILEVSVWLDGNGASPESELRVTRRFNIRSGGLLQ